MYEQFYGLGRPPFRITPDPALYFESASHRQALSYLGYGLGQGEGFIVVTGEGGAGKTMLGARLTGRIDPSGLAVAQVPNPSPGAEPMLHAAACAFGLDPSGHDEAGTFALIERRLQDEARAGRRCLLMVDDCQTLDLAALEALRGLSGIRLGAHPLLQILLLGQPGFRRTLVQHPALEHLRQRIIASHHLEALGEGEVEHYLRHRLGLAGWDGVPALAAGLPEVLYRHTGGNPRRINQAMNRLLLLGAREASDVLLPAMVEAVVAEMAENAKQGAARGATAGLGAAPAKAPPVAGRDASIAEPADALGALQGAGAAAPSGPGEGELAAALARLEARLDEQEQSLRHVLTMLIEWLEDGPMHGSPHGPSHGLSHAPEDGPGRPVG
jgi:type II secretory pathway predicted ATPase ExeA